MIQCEHGYHHGVGDVHACDADAHDGHCPAWLSEALSKRGSVKKQLAKRRALDTEGTTE